ncbi:YncE family protein [Bacillus sp. SM2101]|uniref:YncE family protein n=1 Tax=Bacillus sp. SM2101 TaxID=2805366 RepID=UPI001BDEBFE4|nr:YncE family protein [Bacillus sp. SM2101]
MFQRKLLMLTVMLIILLVGCSNTQQFKPINPHQSSVLSVNIKDASLSFIDISNKEQTESWEINRAVTGGLMFPDQDTLMLYGKNEESAYLYELSTGKELTPWKTGTGIVNGILSSDKNSIYLVDQNRNSIRKFSLTGEELNEIKIGKRPFSMFESNDGERIYVVNIDDTSLSVIDAIHNVVIDTFNINPLPTGGLLREAEKELWLGGHGNANKIETNISVFSLESGKLKEEIAAPTMPIFFSETKEGIFVLSHGSSMIRKFNPSTYEEISAINVGVNPVEMVAMNDELYITSYDSDEVYVIDQKTMEITSTIKVGKGPFQLIKREGER